MCHSCVTVFRGSAERARTISTERMRPTYLDFYMQRFDLLEVLRAAGDPLLPLVRAKLLNSLKTESDELRRAAQPLLSNDLEQRLKAVEAVSVYGDACWTHVRDVDKSPLSAEQFDALMIELQQVPERRRIALAEYVVAHKHASNRPAVGLSHGSAVQRRIEPTADSNWAGP